MGHDSAAKQALGGCNPPHADRHRGMAAWMGGASWHGELAWAQPQAQAATRVCLCGVGGLAKPMGCPCFFAHATCVVFRP